MVNFGRLLGSQPETRPPNPEDIFQGLVRESSLPYLRNVQSKVLAEWFERRNSPNLVVKMNTGSGKTLVGLLMLQSGLNEGLGPSVYLCPTNQLVKQVVDQSRAAGIPTVQFSPTSNEFPPRFVSKDAILVTTFQKVFNGLSVFGVTGGYQRQDIQAGAIVIDDAHSCISVAKDASAISLENNSAVYRKLLSLFKSALSEQSAGTTADIGNSDPSAYLTVPFWAWQTQLNAVAEILSEHRDDNDVKFQWNLVKDDLALCSCVISGRSLQISPLVVPTYKVPFLDSAQRRLFFSATLLDDAALIRDFSVDEQVVLSPITPDISGDIGERLILSPSLVDQELDPSWIRELSVQLATRVNVVVIVPSNELTQFWSAKGAIVATQDNMDDVISRLQTSSKNLVVFVNRYDGIDLAGDACRVLVLDGAPTGVGLAERYAAECRRGSRLMRLMQAQRIEQGLGRGVRSTADYCVCLLATNDLVAFTAARETEQLLSPETFAQITLGKELADELQGTVPEDPGLAVRQLIDQCLAQDPGWKKYHRARIASVKPAVKSSTGLSKLAAAEGFAVKQVRNGRAAAGAQELSNAIAQAGLDEEDKGWYLQVKAMVQNQVDPVQAQRDQQAAHELNPSVCRPIEGARHNRLDVSALEQAESLKGWLAKFADPRAVPVAVADILGGLQFGAPARTFEDSAARLAKALGLRSNQPERESGKGPDVVWYLGEQFLVIECKNEVLLERATISKTEAAQLGSSCEWFRTEYPGKVHIPVLFHPSSVLARDAFPPEGVRVITQGRLAELARHVTDLAAALSAKPSQHWEVEEIWRQLAAQELRGSDIPQRFGQSATRP